MSFFSWCQIVRFIMLVPNCPGAKLSGAKLSVFIMLVPNCPGAKLSGAKLSWCQIVLVPNCPVPNCPVPNCPTTHRWRGSLILKGNWLMYLSLYLYFLSFLWLQCISQSCDIARHRTYSFRSSRHQNTSKGGEGSISLKYQRCDGYHDNDS